MFTKNNVRFGGSLLDDGRVIQGSVHELGVGVLLLDGLRTLLTADEKCEFVVWVSLGDCVEGGATDVSLKAILA